METALNKVIIREPHNYKRTAPSLFAFSGNQDILDWAKTLIAERQAECPGEYYQIIQDCFAYEASYILVGTPIKWLESSVVDYHIKDEIFSKLDEVISGNHHFKNYLVKPNRKTVVIAKSGYRNYGHFLVEIAPKICNIRAANLGPINILIPEGMISFLPILQALCEELSIDAEFSVYEGPKISHYESLYYFGPVSRHNSRKSAALLECVSLLKSIYSKGESKLGRWIYVKRSDDGSRAMPPSFDEFISDLGFEIIQPQNLSMQEQIDIFSAASRVIGPLGAGLTNIIFTQPSCEVFMIDPGLLDFFFWDLSCLTGGKFHWFFSSKIDSYDSARSISPIVLEFQELRYALKKIDWV